MCYVPHILCHVHRPNAPLTFGSLVRLQATDLCTDKLLYLRSGAGWWSDSYVYFAAWNEREDSCFRWRLHAVGGQVTMDTVRFHDKVWLLYPRVRMCDSFLTQIVLMNLHDGRFLCPGMP